MILYLVKSPHMITICNIRTKTINTKKLSLKKDEGFMGMTSALLKIDQKHLSVFGLIFPLGRQKAIITDILKNQEIPRQEWAAEWTAEAKKLNRKTPVDWSVYKHSFILTGTLSTFVLLNFLFISYKSSNIVQNQQNRKAKFADIQAGDRIIVALPGNPNEVAAPDLASMKVIRIQGDTLVVKRNKESNTEARFASVNTSEDPLDDTTTEEEKFKLSTYLDQQVLSSFSTNENIASAVSIEKAR